MSKEQTGGPAFARPLSQHDTKLPGQPVPSQDGMTLRDWFAGEAVGAIIRRMPADMVFRSGVTGFRNQCAEVALAAYQIADAMIEQRSK